MLNESAFEIQDEGKAPNKHTFRKEAPVDAQYWSLDVPTPGMWDVTHELLEAAKARAYKNELILFASDIGHSHLTLNLILNLRRLGYGHYLMIGFNEEACKYMQGLDKNLGCVWDGNFEINFGSRVSQRKIEEQFWRSGEKHPGFYERMSQWSMRGDVAMWVMRWKTMARLVALGYNTMMMDTDLVMLEDVYPYLKGPTLGPFTLMFHSEDHLDTNVQC
eukprot:gene10330-12216_t